MVSYWRGETVRNNCGRRRTSISIPSLHQSQHMHKYKSKIEWKWSIDRLFLPKRQKNNNTKFINDQRCLLVVFLWYGMAYGTQMPMVPRGFAAACRSMRGRSAEGNKALEGERCSPRSKRRRYLVINWLFYKKGGQPLKWYFFRPLKILCLVRGLVECKKF